MCVCVTTPVAEWTKALQLTAYCHTPMPKIPCQFHLETYEQFASDFGSLVGFVWDLQFPPPFITALSKFGLIVVENVTINVFEGNGV